MPLSGPRTATVLGQAFQGRPCPGLALAWLATSVTTAHHAMKVVEEIAGGGKRGYTGIDGGSDERVRPRQLIALHRHQPAEQPGRRRSARRFESGRFAATPPGRPFRRDPQTTPEAGSPQTSPKKLGTVTASRLPLSVEPGERRVQRTRPGTKHIAVSVTQHAADQLAASTNSTRDLGPGHLEQVAC